MSAYWRPGFPPMNASGVEKMRTSRRVWGWLVFALGLLWLVGGLFGYFQGHFSALLLVFCGFVLARMGWRMTSGG